MVSRRQFMKLASFAAVHVSLGASMSAVLSSSACRTPNDLDPDQGPLDPDNGPDANDLVDADALDGAVTVNWQPETIIETPVFDLSISAGSMTETQFYFAHTSLLHLLYNQHSVYMPLCGVLQRRYLPENLPKKILLHPAKTSNWSKSST